MHVCVSDLRFFLLVLFTFSIFQFSSFLSTQNDVRKDLVQDQQQIGCAKKSARIFTLTTFAHLFVLVVSMSVQSFGGDEIHVFSPVGMASGSSGSWRSDGRNSEGKEGEICRTRGPNA